MAAGDPVGGVKEEGEDVVVDEADGEGGDSGDGEGDVVETAPPAKITLPPWLAKALGPAASNFNRVCTVAKSAQVPG